LPWKIRIKVERPQRSEDERPWFWSLRGGTMPGARRTAPPLVQAWSPGARNGGWPGWRQVRGTAVRAAARAGALSR